jgi:hypothetical protein
MCQHSAYRVAAEIICQVAVIGDINDQQIGAFPQLK